MASAEPLTQKVLATIDGAMIAPRLDLATEVQILTISGGVVVGQPRSILLPSPSADELCGLVLKENIGVLICGGISEEHHQFLRWKNVEVIDRVIGSLGDAIKKFRSGSLAPGMIIKEKTSRRRSP